MSSATDLDSLSKACEAGSAEACELLRRKRMAGFKDGGLLADASRTWRMESDYPEFEKGVANRLSKERVPEAVVEEQFNYSPLQRGYAEGGEVENFMDETGSMLAPEVPLNFEDEMGDEMMLEDDIMMEEEMSMEGEDEILNVLSPEDQEVLFQAMSDYPELEGILNSLTDFQDSPEVFDEEGSVEGPGTGTSDSINAKLSDGEFVFTAKAVSHLGVDKLRKMMAKAEMDYDEADAKQQFAQMGDEGFASGGLLTKPKYGSYSQGGSVPDDSLGPRRQTFKYNTLKKWLKQGAIKEDQIIHLSGDNFRIKGPIKFAHGGEVTDSILGYETGGMTRYGKSVMTDYYHPFKNKRERDEAIDYVPYAKFKRWLGTKIFKALGVRTPEERANDKAGAMRHEPDFVYRSGAQ